MADEDQQEEEQSARLKHSLLVRLKTTVEGLLANNTSNVWSTYGGLGRLCKDVDQILHHRLKFVAGDYGSVNDYWPFVKGLKWLKPEMTPFIERIRKGPYQKGTSKGQIWVKESLREHNLVLQLKVLVTSEQHLHRHYFDQSCHVTYRWKRLEKTFPTIYHLIGLNRTEMRYLSQQNSKDAFLFNDPYFKAMCLCLQAVEENRVSLLADIDPKLLNFKPFMTKVVPSHIRSASLPLSNTSSRIHCRRSHLGSYNEALALAPPFASPSRDSFLYTSDDQAVAGMIASSASPEESKIKAKDALRDVLRKSGSDSPPDLPPPGNQGSMYSFYDDSLNSDPLLNLGFIQGSRSPRDTEQSDKKPVLTRSASEATVLKKQLDRRASEMMDKILVEDDDNSDVFKVDSGKSKVKTTENKVKEKSPSPPKPSRVIFSDSEEVDHRDVVKHKTGKHTHKRSRSDISGIKMTLTSEQSDYGLSKSQTLKEPISMKGAMDEVDSGNGGFFPQPTKGQSLLHYLSSQDFHTCANLDKENAHFSICEALIAAIEQMKWNHVLSPKDDIIEEEDSDEEIKQLQQRIRIRKRQRLKEKARGFPVLSDGRTDTTPTTSQSHSDSPYSSPYDSDYSDSEASSGADEKQIELTMEDSQGNMKELKNSGLSLSMASLYSDADIQKKGVSMEREISFQDTGTMCLSAESVAISLLRKFSEKQLPKASDLQWLVTEQDAPQRLLPLPNSTPISPDDADKTLSNKTTRLRGNLEWAPPRAQIIFNIHPTPQRNTLLGKQNYKCAGCGMKVETGYAKRYRYCEYLGKYFCKCCHSNHMALIPARMLQRWDFTKYPVSNFAKENILNKISNEALFNVADINPSLYKRVKWLQHIKDWRIQLHHIKNLLNLCKQAKSLSDEIANLPNHWTNDIHVYTINDLVSIKSGATGHMYTHLKNLVTDSIGHIEHCQFCQCFGFICEMCRDQKDIIFPYQLHKVSICQGCKTCFHKNCFVPQKCPKCARIDARKKRLQEESLEDDKDDTANVDDG